MAAWRRGAEPVSERSVLGFAPHDSRAVVEHLAVQDGLHGGLGVVILRVDDVRGRAGVLEV